MMRSTFFAAGLFLALWGVTFLFVDKIELKLKSDPKPEPGFRGLLTRVTTTPQPRKVISPPDWAAFSLMSLGAVTMLYAVALPKKKPE
jgi:hypothetical protein